MVVFVVRDSSRDEDRHAMWLTLLAEETAENKNTKNR
jgi:hypothetical protein